MTTSWQRRSGLVTGKAARADHVRGFLEGALVIALVELEPDNIDDAVGITVATDDEDRVAVVDDDRTTIVPGPSLTELAEALAATCEGEVAFDDLVVGEAEPTEDPSDPFDPQIDILAAYVPDRAVVFTRASLDELGSLVHAVDMPVLVAPHSQGHLVLVTDGPALSAVDWSDALKPALVIEQGAAYPAVAIIEADSAYVHTWDVEISAVPGEPAAAAVAREFADTTLGLGGLTSRISALLPDVDPGAIRTALEGAGSGPRDLIAALALPAGLSEYLAHGEAPDLADATILQPDGFGQAFARAVTDAQAQMSESVREHTEQMRERAEQVRERAEAARVRAESAFDAAETFTEEVVVPIRQSWWTPAVAAVEATGGALLLRRAGRGSRLGTGTTAGERVLAVGGLLLLVDAVVNTIVFLAPRFRRDL